MQENAEKEPATANASDDFSVPEKEKTRYHRNQFQLSGFSDAAQQVERNLGGDR